MKIRTLVSGTSSGLGSYLAEVFSSDRYNRHQNKIIYNEPKSRSSAPFNTIVHAACGKVSEAQSYNEYIDYQLQLTRRLICYGHDRFVFISTVDVYQEKENLTLYAKAKLCMEREILGNAKNPVILRVGSLIGPGMRVNQLLRVAIGDMQPLSLSPKSTFSLTFYNQIIDQILTMPSGIHDIAPDPLLTLGEIAAHFGHTPTWGEFDYQTRLPEKKLRKPCVDLRARLEILNKLKEFILNRGWERENGKRPRG